MQAAEQEAYGGCFFVWVERYSEADGSRQSYEHSQCAIASMGQLLTIVADLLTSGERLAEIDRILADREQAEDVI